MYKLALKPCKVLRLTCLGTNHMGKINVRNGN